MKMCMVHDAAGLNIDTNRYQLHVLFEDCQVNNLSGSSVSWPRDSSMFLPEDIDEACEYDHRQSCFAELFFSPESLLLLVLKTFFWAS